VLTNSDNNGVALTSNNSVSTTFSGTLSGAGSLVKSGAGKLTLSSSNSFTGGVTLNSGTISLGNVKALGSGTVTLAGGTLDASGLANFANVLNSLVVNGTATYNHAPYETAGPVSGSGTLNINLSSAQSIGDFSAFTGKLNVLKSWGKIGSGSVNMTVNLSAGAGLYLNAATVNMGALSGDAGSYLNGGASGGLSVGALNSNTIFSGTLVYTSGGLTKVGTGSLTLAGINTYTGGTKINSGILEFSAMNAMPSSGTVTGSSGATLAVAIGGAGQFTNGTSGAGTIGGLLSGTGGQGAPVTWVAGMSLGIDTTAASGTYAGVISTAGTTPVAIGLTKLGANTLTLTASNSYTGATTINGGALSIGSINGLAGTSGVSIGAGASLAYTGGTDTFAKNITVSSGTGSVTNTGGATLTLSGTLSKNGTVLRLTGGAFDVTGHIVGSSANSDVVVDAATLTLSSSNSYNGPTYLINSGTLIANAAYALPTANGRTDVYMDQTGSGNSTLSLGASQSIASLTGSASSTVTLGNNTLTIGTTSGTTTFAGSISGVGGSLVKDGPSTQVLSGNSSYTGATNVNAGRLIVSGSLTGSTNVTGSSGATLDLNNGSCITTSGTVAITGTLALSGSGTIGALNMNAGSTLATTITGTSAGQYGQISTTGGITLSASGSGVKLSITTEYSRNVVIGDLANSDHFVLVLGNGAGGIGTFSNVTMNVPDPNYGTVNEYTDTNNNVWALFYNVNGLSSTTAGSGSDIALYAIPEPQTSVILMGGIGMLVMLLRRRAWEKIVKPELRSLL